MSPQPKKPASSQSAKEFREVTLRAVEGSKNASEAVVSASSDVMRDFFSNGAQEAKRAQEKVLEFSKEGAESLAKAADAFTKALSECMVLSREQMEAMVEFSNIAARITKDAGGDALNFSNASFAENLESSKSFFTCKNVNDFVDFYNDAYRSNIDNFFKASMKASDYLFEFASEAFEPFGEKASEAWERISKTLK